MQPDPSKSALQKTNSKMCLATAIGDRAPIGVWTLPLQLLLLLLQLPLLTITLLTAPSPPLLSNAVFIVVVVVTDGVPVSCCFFR